MKDHELRELINDVTAVAQIYAHTQQLREQISHLITPVFQNLQDEARLGHNLFADQVIRADKLNRQLDFEVKQRIELRKNLEVAKGQYQGACDIIKNLEVLCEKTECHPAACRDEMIWRKVLLEAEITVLETAFNTCKPYGEEFRHMITERQTCLKKDYPEKTE